MERVGLVVQHGANRTWVLEQDGVSGATLSTEGEEWSCTLRGKLRQGRRDLVRAAVIGDRVRFSVGDAATRRGAIESILPRRNQVSRPQPSGGARRVLEQVIVANLDRLWVLASLAQPPLNLRFVDRILAAAAFQGVDAGVVLNKCDLAEAADPDPIAALYAGLGYPVLVSSVRDGLGVPALREQLSGKIGAFVGLSGVGKSSLLRALQPELELRIQAVGERHGHGRHTTSASRLYPLDGGGFLADTPGMREFGLWGVFQHDLSRCFVEIERCAAQCRFRDCLHGTEPGCAVRTAAESGELNAGRYASYRALLEELPFDELDKAGILKGPRR